MSEPWEDACAELEHYYNHRFMMPMFKVVTTELREAKAEVARLNGIIDEFREDAELLKEIKLAKAALELMKGLGDPI